MPIYEIKCKVCGHEMEFFKINSNDNIPVCPNCGECYFIQKPSTSTSFILKGGGWAKDNYSSSSKQ